MHQVLTHLDGQITANRPRCCFTGVGGTDESASDLVRLGALDHHRHQWASGDERDQFAKEGLLGVLGVMHLGRRGVELAQLEGDQRELLRLKSGNDLAHELAFNRIGLTQNQSAISHKARNVGRARGIRRVGDPGARNCPVASVDLA